MGMPLLAAAAGPGTAAGAGALPGVEVAEPGCRVRSEALRCGGGACPGLASGGLPVGDCTPLGTPPWGMSTLNPANTSAAQASLLCAQGLGPQQLY